MVDHIDRDAQPAPNLGHPVIDLFVVGRGKRQVGLFEIAGPILARDVLNASLVAKLTQIRAQLG